jgi:catechol-2,3-dioxygenase
LITGYSGVAVEVSDLGRAADFYSGVLGFGPTGETPGGLLLHLNAAQSVTLVPRPDPRTFPESGVHQAYGLPAPQLDATLSRVEAAGIEMHRYHEDRDVEQHHNRYCADPDRNRVQLIAARETGIDHVAFETHDIEWAEVFYTQVLGARVELRVGWRMEDFARAWAWGSGDDECAPGARRWDSLYTDDKARVPRPSPQLYVQFAEGVTLGLYLATLHRQEPPRGLYQGTPWAAFWVQSGGLGELERRLCEIRLRCMEASAQFKGPYERVGSALYVRDPSGNFLEFREQPA